jgi:DoxX
MPWARREPNSTTRRPAAAVLTRAALLAMRVTKGTILDYWLADKQEWAPIALRVPLGVIFFAHGAQKMFGWFSGYGWNGTMQYFTQSLHIPAPLAAVAIPVELLR